MGDCSAYSHPGRPMGYKENDISPTCRQQDWAKFRSILGESELEPVQVDIEEAVDRAIGIGPRHDREDREQKHVGQSVKLAFRPMGISHKGGAILSVTRSVEPVVALL